MLSKTSRRFAPMLMSLVVLPSMGLHANQLNTDEIFANGFGATMTYYVATNGDDIWSGTLSAPNSSNSDGPFATFDHARSVVQGLDKSNLERVFVQFRGGTYTVTSAVEFTKPDSGSAQTEIVYENYPGESPIVSGGVRVTNWTNTSGNVWTTTLTTTPAKFENLYYDGQRRLRPRLGGFLGVYNRVWNTVTLQANDPTLNDACPADDGYECFDRFDYNPVYGKNDPTSLDPSKWGNLVAADGNLCNQAAGPEALQGDIEVLVFEQFSTSKLHVSCVDTANHRVYFTGPTTVPGPGNASEAGFIQGNRFIVENVKNALTDDGQWFFDVTNNLLTYLTNTGEDPNAHVVTIPQSTQLLVAYEASHLTFRGLTFEFDNYTIPPQGHASSELESRSTSALSFQNSSNIRIDGVLVRNTAGGGLDFISCLEQYDASGNEVSPDWCVGFDPNATVDSNTIVNSAFFDLGVGGIRIGENTATAEQIKVTTYGNVPKNFLVENNVVSGYGRVLPAAFGIGQGVGHNNLYTHNDVYDGYHCAISISHGGFDMSAPNGQGNAYNTISFNNVHDLLQGIMNDGGSIRIEAGNGVATSPGNHILNNIIHDTSDASAIDFGTVSGIQIKSGYGGDGIYMDNSTGLVDVENNLVYRVSGFAVYTPHGPQNTTPVGPQGFGQANYVNNNIFALTRRGMFAVNDPYYLQEAEQPPPTSFTANPVFLASNNVMYFDRDETASAPFYVVGDCTYSANLGFADFERFEGNQYFRVDGNFDVVDNAFHVQTSPASNNVCSKTDVGNWSYYYFGAPNSPSWQVDVGEDANSVVQDPLFKNPVYPVDDFTLTGPSLPIGFVPFDLTAPGRQNPTFDPPAIPPTFVTAPYDPSSEF